MDEQAIDLGSVEFERPFQRSDHGVDAFHGQIVGQRAVAADLDVVAGVTGGADAAASDKDLVDIEDLRKLGGDVAEADFEFAIAFQRSGGLDGRGLAFDVGENGDDGGDLAAHLGLQVGDQFVGLAQRHGLVHFQMLFDMQAAVDVLHGDLVDGKVAAGGDGADAVVDALVERVCSLAQGLHQLDADASPAAIAALERRLADARSGPADAPDLERRLQLLERQHATLNDLAARRGTVADQLERASLVLQTMKLDLFKLRSSGLDAKLDASTGATQEARALSTDIGRVIDAANEVRKL